MKRKTRILPQADSDLEEFAHHIAKDSLAAAIKLYDAAESAFFFLADTPFAGALAKFEREEARDLRTWRIKGYPNHVIIYRVTDDAVIIVRVVHAAQDRDRLSFGDRPQA